MVKPSKVLAPLIYLVKKVRKIADIKNSWINELKVLLEKKKSCLEDILAEISDIEVELATLTKDSETLKPGAELLLLAQQRKDL